MYVRVRIDTLGVLWGPWPSALVLGPVLARALLSLP